MKPRALAVGVVDIEDAIAALTSGNAPVIATSADGSLLLSELKIASMTFTVEQIDVTSVADQFTHYVCGPRNASVCAKTRGAGTDLAALLDGEIELDQTFGRRRLRGRMKVTSVSMVSDASGEYQAMLEMVSIGTFDVSEVPTICVTDEPVVKSNPDRRALALDGKIS